MVELFDHLPAVYFFVKDASGRFVHVNKALREVLGVEESGMIGRTDHDFFSAELADRYIEEDRRVIQTGCTLCDQVWLVPDRGGALRWFLSTKMPLRDRRGRGIGIAAVMQDIERSGAVLAPYQRFSAVVEHVIAHYADRISVAQLAQLAHLSVSQLIRRFRAHFGTTPARYIRRVRVNAAARLLIETDQTVEQIAGACGFYDASHFVKQFKHETGATPHAYRTRAAG